MRKYILLSSILILAFSTPVVKAGQEANGSLIRFTGTYRLTLSDQDKADGVPADQKIVLNVARGVLSGNFYGVENAADSTGDESEGNGWIYFEAPLEKLKITQSGTVSFEVGYRKYYTAPAGNKGREKTGFSRSRLLYTGTITKREIRIKCSGNGCWTESDMTFKRINEHIARNAVN